MKSPIIYFGKKARVADVIWQRLGDPTRYTEPFMGSVAILLAKPATPTRVEVCNDANAHVCNFFRAMASDPDAVARAARGPKHEAEIAARHRWLLSRHDDLRRGCMADVERYDAQAAGWWLYGNASWLGSGWCDPARDPDRTQVPHPTPQGYHAIDDFDAYAHALQERLLGVTFLCGDWTRAVTPAMLGLHVANVVSAVVLDPPYDGGCDGVYADGDKSVWHAAQRWALEHGDDPRLRICLCGYEGVGAPMPPEWEVYRWDTGGAYQAGAEGAGRENGRKEAIWFSKYCNRQISLL